MRSCNSTSEQLSDSGKTSNFVTSLSLADSTLSFDEDSLPFSKRTSQSSLSRTTFDDQGNSSDIHSTADPLPDFSPCTSKLAMSTEASKKKFSSATRTRVDDNCFSFSPIYSPNKRIQLPYGSPNTSILQKRLGEFLIHLIYRCVALLPLKVFGRNTSEATQESSCNTLSRNSLSSFHQSRSQGSLEFGQTSQSISCKQKTPKNTSRRFLIHHIQALTFVITLSVMASDSSRQFPRFTFVGVLPNDSTQVFRKTGHFPKQSASCHAGRLWMKYPLSLVRATLLSGLCTLSFFLSAVFAMFLVIFAFVLENSPLQEQHLV